MDNIQIEGTYTEFLKSKLSIIEDNGIKEISINDKLFDFQKYVVEMALKKGRFSIFAGTGTGKTFMQLEYAKNVLQNTNKPVLILAPLAVSMQTINEAAKLDLEVSKFKNNYNPGIYISNYEQLDNIDLSKFSGIVLDESSILKSIDGKIKNKILQATKNIQYKLACTATPSPNDIAELGNHSEFMNVMSRNEMLSKYFIHDSGQTSVWRLKKYGEMPFYSFVSQWAIMFQKPHDIGFIQDGYELPPLNYYEMPVTTTTKEGFLFNKGNINAIEFNRELRKTTNERIDKIASLVNNSNEPFLIWARLNDEAMDLHKAIPGSINVQGSDSIESKEDKLIGFSKGEFRVLITKPKIAQFGMNFQNCNNQVFMSLDFSMESLYQSIRRSYRYGQTKPVNIYIVTLDTMSNIKKIIDKKENNFNKMQQYISNIYINQRNNYGNN